MVGGVTNSNMPSIVGGANASQTTQTDGSQGAQQTDAAQGVSAQQGATPDATGANARLANISGNMALMQSLLAMMPPFSSEDEDVILAEIETKMKETLSKTDVEAIKNKQNEKLAMIQQKAAQDQESAKKMQDALDKQEHASIWDKIKLAFQVLAAVIAVVVAIAAIATGVGAPMGALLIAGAITSIIMAIDAIVTEATPDHLGIAGSIKLATDHSDRSHDEKVKDARGADQAFGYAMMAVGAALAIACIAAAPTKLLDIGTQVAKTVMRVGDMVGAVTEMAGAGVGVGAAVENYNAASDQVDALKEQSKGTGLKAAMKQIDEVVDMLIKQLEGVQDTFNASIDALIEAKQDQAKTLTHAFAV